MRRWIALALVVAACGGSGDAAPTTTEPSTTATTIRFQELVVPPQLEDLDVVTVSIGGRDLAVAVADTPTLRSTGLMFITDLDDLDGMAFVYTEDTTTSFYMLDTLIPLDIAFFAADGAFVSKTTMTPCTTDTCPRYRAADRYRYAIEVPAGEFDWLDQTARLGVDALAG